VTILPGKQYIDRKGNVWTVLSVHDGWHYPVTAKKVGADEQIDSFTADGRWSRHVTWPNDLIAEASALGTEVAA
jgi:hypothetical protein